MITYNIHRDVEASSTCIGNDLDFAVITPQRQAHGTRVAVIPDEADNTDGVDALITNREGVRIGVRTADCVPILLYDPVRRVAAAVHSGWKGTVANVIAVAVGRMQAAYGTAAEDLLAVIGPCIHVDAFEVGDEVYERFAEAGYGGFCRRSDKWHVDLPAVCRHQLEQLGVSRVEVCEECTYAQHDCFYSYRHSQGAIGNHRIINSIMIISNPQG